MTKSDKSKKSEQASDDDQAAQILALTDALQRERADAINSRRQHEEQLANLRVLVKANVVRDLLPVIDNFERALKHEPSTKPDETVESLQKALVTYVEYTVGVRGLVKQFEKTLTDIGVARILTVGEPFDPKYHEAVSMEEGDGGTREIVSEELQAGYRVGDDVIRHAMVRVRLEAEDKDG